MSLGPDHRNYFQQSEPLSSESNPVHLENIGFEHLAHGRIIEAATCIENAAANFDNSDQKRIGLFCEAGNIYLSSHNYPEAAHCFERALKAAETHIGFATLEEILIRSDLIVAKLGSGDITAASEIVSGLNELIFCIRRQDILPIADKICELAKRSLIFEDTGVSEQIVNLGLEFCECVALDEQRYEMRRKLNCVAGHIALMNGNIDDAIQAFKGSISPWETFQHKHTEEEIGSRRILASLLVETGKPYAAEKILRETLAITTPETHSISEVSDIKLEIAEVLLLRSYLIPAEKLAAKVIVPDEEEGRSIYSRKEIILGEVALRKGCFVDAERHFRNVLRDIDSNNEGSQSKRVRKHALMGLITVGCQREDFEGAKEKVASILSEVTESDTLATLQSYTLLARINREQGSTHEVGVTLKLARDRVLSEQPYSINSLAGVGYLIESIRWNLESGDHRQACMELVKVDEVLGDIGAEETFEALAVLNIWLSDACSGMLELREVSAKRSTREVLCYLLTERNNGEIDCSSSTL